MKNFEDRGYKIEDRDPLSSIFDLLSLGHRLAAANIDRLACDAAGLRRD
jgi:hypothetical protein